ncbi:MAG: hypothetical protein IKF68_07080 [Erysipelotrichaceae bacterium]|nr:hypothetical protein [Erysipelotrichaceae bacterium]
MVFFRSIKKVSFLISLVLIAIGYLFISRGAEGIDLCLQIAAAGLGAAGLFSMIRYFMLQVDVRYKRNDFAMGVIIIAMGAFLYLLKDRLTDMIHIIAGVVMIMSGLFCIQDAIDGRQIGMPSVAVYLFLLVIEGAFGAIAILKPFADEALHFIVNGIGMIVCGAGGIISNILLAGYHQTYENRLRRDHEEKNRMTIAEVPATEPVREADPIEETAEDIPDDPEEERPLE